jgi:hypothetical protein
MSRWQKKKPGDPLKIPAGAYNEMLDLLAQRENLQTSGGDITRPAGLVKIKNNSGTWVRRFAVLGIDDQLINTYAPPVGNTWEFRSCPLLVGVTPRAPDHYGRFAVTQEAIPDGGIGWAMVSGLTPVRVNIRVGRAEATWADCEPGNTYRMEGYNAGSAKILWRVSGTGTKWSLVNLGVPAVAIFWARITGSTQIGENKWEYTFEEVTPADSGGWTTTYLGMTGTAYNTIETINDGQGVEGAGWDVDVLSTQYYQCCLGQTLSLSGERPCKLKPVPTGTIVAMRRDLYLSSGVFQMTFRFQFVNPVECQPPSDSGISASSTSDGSEGCQTIEVVTGATFDEEACDVILTKQLIRYRPC